MNLSKLFEMQKALDERIVSEKGMEGQDLLPKKILALQVELGELANEWRGFKFWSNKQEPLQRWSGGCKLCDYWEAMDSERRSLRPDGSECDCYQGLRPKNAVLEEYVDCLHFILSIGLETGFDQMAASVHSVEVDIDEITECFLHISTWLVNLYTLKKPKCYWRLVDVFMHLGHLLNLSLEEIEHAYMSKNAVNHDRQSSGY
ncbi:dUTP diphosphatase [Paenibacillus thermotolerans]|uniref:dUTP diphosphatase n=1 Tax=Paenibacillus thermotolerans TaxID=3027807 RepID=UPI0023682CC0|nr:MULTISPECIES: dUTP diphosphatase [unclassified Paenibacillus]